MDINDLQTLKDEKQTSKKLNSESEIIQKKRISGIFQDIFDYDKERLKIRQEFELWRNDEVENNDYQQAISLLN